MKFYRLAILTLVSVLSISSASFAFSISASSIQSAAQAQGSKYMSKGVSLIQDKATGEIQGYLASAGVNQKTLSSLLNGKADLGTLNSLISSADLDKLAALETNSDEALESINEINFQEKLSQAANQNLRAYPTSPFRSGKDAVDNGSGTVMAQAFELFTRDLSVSTNYQIFQQVVTQVLGQTGLCSAGSSIEDQLQTCANEKPDEFATASNMIRYYLEWQSSELRTFLSLYQGKLISPILKDRIEGRLIGYCLQGRLAAGEDTSSALSSCRDPQAWPISKAFYATCQDSPTNLSVDGTPFAAEYIADSATGADSSNVFDYKAFVSSCVISKSVTDSLGSSILLNYIPDFAIGVQNNGLTVVSRPSTLAPQTAYSMIYSGLLSQLSSPWFTNLETGGCLASVFAPISYGDAAFSESSRSSYYSVCIPTNLITDIASLPNSDAELFRGILAQRLAVLQVVEFLNGAILVTSEAERLLMATDREIGTLVKSYPEYLKQLKQMYMDSISLTYSTSLEDVVAQVIDLHERYAQEIASLDSAQRKIQAELAIQKAKLDTGQ